MVGLTFASGERPPDSTGARVVNTWRASTGQVVATLHANACQRWIDWHGVGLFAFTDLSRSVHVWPVDHADHCVIHDVFRRAILPAVFQACGLQALHASAARRDAGLLVFCGRSGSGKSTVAYALGRRALTQVADDVVVIDAVRPEVTARALPFAPRLRAPSREHFAVDPDHGSLQPAGGGGRVIAFFLLSQQPGLGGSRVDRLAPSAAFSRLLSHAHSFDPVDAAEARRLAHDYLAMVEQVPVFEVRYQPGLAHLPALIDAILAAAGNPAAASTGVGPLDAAVRS